MPQRFCRLINNKTHNDYEQKNAGAYLDFRVAATRETPETPSLLYPVVAVHYGGSVSCHLLPADTERWDVSFRGVLGGYWYSTLFPQPEYGVGFNVAYYPFDHLGIFVENMWGRFLFNQFGDSMMNVSRLKLKAGISYRF